MVVRDGSVEVLSSPRVSTVNVAGTGDSLSAAVAAGLACGLTVDEAIRAAKVFVARAVAGAARWSPRSGPGPIDHLGWSNPT